MIIPSAPSREGIGTPFGAQGGRVDAIDGAGAARRHEAARRLRRCHTADVGQVEIAQISPGAASLPQNQPAAARARRADPPSFGIEGDATDILPPPDSPPHTPPQPPPHTPPPAPPDTRSAARRKKW